MKFISWNVNGLRAVAGKGFADIFEGFDADWVCLQETKLQAGQIDLEFPGYQSYWNYAEKPGYSGTAVYTRHTPLSVRYGLGVPEHDQEGSSRSNMRTSSLSALMSRTARTASGAWNTGCSGRMRCALISAAFRSRSSSAAT